MTQQEAYTALQEPSSHPTSAVLRQAAASFGEERIALADFVRAGEDRGILLAIVLCTLPNTLPIPLPPGVSTIFAVPVWFMALQLLIGRTTLWLPTVVGRKTLPVSVVQVVLEKGAGVFGKLERFIRQRPMPLPFALAERVGALLIMLLSTLIALPIPFGNLAPAVAVVLLCVSLMERDGLLMAIAWAATGLALGWVSMVGLAFFKGATVGLEWLKNLL